MRRGMRKKKKKRHTHTEFTMQGGQHGTPTSLRLSGDYDDYYGLAAKAS